MDDFYKLSDSQRDQVFQLMEIIGNNNIELAQVILTMNGWNLQAAIDNFMNEYSSQSQMVREESMKSEDEVFQNQDLENKIDDFNTLFPEVKISQQMSDLLSIRRRSSTTKDELIRVQQYAERLAKDNPKFRYTLDKSQRQIENNRKFIQFLNNEYKTSINFALGSFSSNLMKAYVKKKPLLVYVHSTTGSKAANSILTRILQDSNINKFVNTNFVVYGMFDNSEDYSIVQPNLSPTMLPGFAVFVYDQKNKSEKCLGAKRLLRNQPKSIVDFMTEILGKVSTTKEAPQNIKNIHEAARQSERSLKDEQQQIYDMMEHEFKMKRQQSKLRKINLEQAKANVDLLKKQFDKEPSGTSTIQIHFRLPLTGKLLSRRFQQKDKVHRLFAYVQAFCSQDFENEYGDFDLVQTYPPLSLVHRKQQTLQKVFEGSTGETLIIKQI